MAESKGTLYLLPSYLGDNALYDTIPQVKEIINIIDEYIVENIRSARRFLLKASITKPIDDITFIVLDKHSNKENPNDLIKGLLKGRNIGLLSEAGYPCVADPGASVVLAAHKQNIRVVAFPGPSSIIMALACSGLNGQSFTFLGYLPKEKNERIKALRQIESIAVKENRTQIFIETPYRNEALIQDILKTCHEDTFLCIASDITLPSEYIRTMRVGEWRQEKRIFNGHPAVFLISR